VFESVTAGYSGTPLVKKLGIAPDHAVALVDAPVDFAVHHLVDCCVPARLAGTRPLDIVIAFVTTRAKLAAAIAAAKNRLVQNGALWIAWPKKSSGVATEVTENTVRELALPTGLVDNKVCAIDETWSGLRLVIRRELRAAPKPARRRASKKSAGR
jgi:hypothetical protein